MVTLYRILLLLVLFALGMSVGLVMVILDVIGFGIPMWADYLVTALVAVGGGFLLGRFTVEN